MRKISAKRIGIGGLSILKYIIGVFMVYAGFITMTAPLAPYGGDLGWLYATRPTLVGVGLVIMISGALILYGKAVGNRKIVGWGLIGTHACFTFATAIHIINTGLSDAQTIANGTAMIITGTLYLRWKYKFFYEEPKHRAEVSTHFRA